MTRLLEPGSSDDTAAFWAATRDRRLVVPWCPRCDRGIWYPRLVCPGCLGEDLDQRELGGDGVVYAVSVQHRPGPGRDPDDGPYAVVLVDLDDGIRLLSNVVGCAADDVTVGLAVTLDWEPLSDGRHLPVFRPASVL